VLIGTSDYKHLPPVPAARNSLDRMRELLTGRLCGWPDDRITVIVNPTDRGRLDDELIQLFSPTGSDDVALFYYVGHGQADPQDQLCLGLVESRTEHNRRASTSLRFDAIRNAIGGCDAGSKIVIIDCCFAGLAARQTLSADEVLDMLGGTGAYTMAATGAYMRAWYETDVDRPQTYFTKYLIDVVESGIKGAPVGLPLHQVFRAVANDLVRDGKPQPTSIARHDAGNFTFAWNAAGSVDVTPGSVATSELPADGDKMVTVTVTEADRVASVRPSTVWGGVPPRNINFTGRDDLLDHVRDLLRSAGGSTLVLGGLGGVGKTHLAIEYAYRFQDDYDLVWWVPADDERLIRRSIVSLARRLGLPESADVDDTIGVLLDALRRGYPHERWLFIFDNAGEPGVIRSYRPHGARGHVLITSRSSRWTGSTETVPVDVFTEDESVDMLGKRWRSLSSAEARSLGERLGNLPLALEQAAAVHNESGMTLKEYLTALDETPFRVLDEGIPAGYPNSLAEAFRVAYRELKSKSEAAAQLFGVCAMMGSQPISVSMLIRGRSAALPWDGTLSPPSILVEISSGSIIWSATCCGRSSRPRSRRC
jgi:hypothetical protein